MKIKIIRAAENDLEEGYLFYEAREPGLGSYFLDSLYSDIDSLAYFGGMHQIVLGYHRQLSRRFPFAIYYRIIDDIVVIFAVLDCRRNPSWIRGKLMKS